MSIVRLIVTWLVMAALPLQGLAAASMLFCDQANHSTISERQAAHDHGSHGHGHGHQASSSASGQQDAGHDHASHDHGGQGGLGDAGPDMQGKHSAQSADKGSTVDDHACPICASCCNLVALSEPLSLGSAADLPTAQPLHEPARVITRDSPTPDKPPRA